MDLTPSPLPSALILPCTAAMAKLAPRAAKTARFKVAAGSSVFWREHCCQGFSKPQLLASMAVLVLFATLLSLVRGPASCGMGQGGWPVPLSLLHLPCRMAWAVLLPAIATVLARALVNRLISCHVPCSAAAQALQLWPGVLKPEQLRCACE